MAKAWFKWDCSELWEWKRKAGHQHLEGLTVSEESDHIRGYDGAWLLALKSREKKGLICSKTLRKKKHCRNGVVKGKTRTLQNIQGSEKCSMWDQTRRRCLLRSSHSLKQPESRFVFSPLSSSCWAVPSTLWGQSLSSSGNNLKTDIGY